MEIKKRVKILHLVEAFSRDGRTSLLYELINQTNEKYEHQILALKWIGPLSEKFINIGVKVSALGIENILRIRSKKENQYHTIRKVIEFKPDVCICWCGLANIISIVFKVFKIPVIWTIHNTIENWAGAERKYGIIACSILSRFVPFRIVCCSENCADIYKNFHLFSKKKVVVISNGVNINKFKPDSSAKKTIRDEFNIDQNTLIVAVPTRMELYKKNKDGDFKDIKTLFRAAKKVIEKNKKIHFLIFGSNIDYENPILGDLLKKEKISKNINLLGFREDVNKIFAGSELIAMSSITGEGLPLSLLEAMATGSIPVCTDSGEIKNVIKDVGYLVSQKNFNEIANCILEIGSFSKDELNLKGKSVINKIKTKYAMQSTCKSYEKLIERSIRKK